MKHSPGEKDGPSSAESDPKRHKKDESGSTKPKKDSNSKNVLVLTSTDVRKNNGKIYLADAKEISLLKETERGRYKKEMMFFKTMTEEDVEEELRRHFPILRNGGRFCCATVVEKKTRPRLEFHDDPPTVWDGITIHRRTRGNASLYVFFESGQGTSEVVCERTELQTVDSLQQQLETPMTKPMNKTSGKRKNDESDPAAKRAKEVCATVEPPLFITRTPILFHPVNMAQIEPQGHPATSTMTMMQNHISLQKFYVDQSSRATGFPKNSTPVTHTRTSSTFVLGQQTQASGSMCDWSGSLQNKSSLLLETSQSAGSSIASRCAGTSLHSATQQRREDQEQSYKPEVVPEVTLQPGNINGGPVSAFPTTGFQSDLTATEPSPSQRSPLTCLADNTAGGQISLNTQALGASFTEQAGDQIFQHAQASGASLIESGILYIDPSQQPAATADQQPISHESDSGQDSIRSNTLGVAEASDTAEQSGDISALSEIFGASEDFDSALEEGSEAWFDFLTQSSGVVDEIIPPQGPTEKNIRFCIILAEKLHRKYETSNLQAKFEGIGTVPLQKRDEKTLTGSINSCLAGKVKVYLEFEGSNERSIGSTDFEFIKNNDQVIRERLSKLEMGQDELFKTLGTLAGAFSSRSRGVQQATPRGAGGTGSSNVNKRDDAILEKILTLLVYKAAEIDGREFLEMVFSTSAGRLVFNHYRNSSTSPGDVARANGHTNLGDFLEDVNERLSKEVCYEDSYETVDWLGLKHAVEKKVCPPSTDDAQSVDSPGGDMNQSGYEADDEVSPLPSPADADAIGSEMDDSQHESSIHADSGQITLDKNDTLDSIATEAERQRHQIGNNQQAGTWSSFTNRDDSEEEIEPSPHGTDNVEKNSAQESSAGDCAGLIPDWAYTEEKRELEILFLDPLPDDVISYMADFEGLGVANLIRKNSYTLVGYNPISLVQREVTVRILILTENNGYMGFGECLKFTYKDQRSEFWNEFLPIVKNREAVGKDLLKRLPCASTESGDLNAFRPPEVGYVSGEIDCKYKILFWIIIILNLFISDASFLDCYSKSMFQSKKRKLVGWDIVRRHGMILITWQRLLTF